MRISFSIFRDCKYQVRRERCAVVAPISSSSFNLCEEYTNAFRTESYAEFWAQVLDLTLDHGEALKPRGSTAPARLPSSLLLAEHLLTPDQPTVAEILAPLRSRFCPELHALLSDYYAETADASLLCSVLLKDIDQIRRRYCPLKATLHSLVSGSSSLDGLRAIDDYVADADISKAIDRFNSLAASQRKFRKVQEGTAELLRRLESGRKKARAKRRLINRVRRTAAISAVVLVASTSIVGACIAAHALLALVALPAFASLSSSRKASGSRLEQAIAQLDVAAKGTYILNRELDTISRLVARLHDEEEHMHGLLRLLEWHGGGGEGHRRRLTQEVVRQMRKSLGNFYQQVDELEEHLCLCFMTINRARRLVTAELLVADCR